ncbi:MAG: aminotransferase class I/II-fold pyridoxal phosphate-dependent enzyme [Hyphomicrobiaceae bacterium]|nr:aminotransferase class I/II-fold pyridoxal phosphate-dependent enzyme [Hyphomicrobiaceae bacterium]
MTAVSSSAASPLTSPFQRLAALLEGVPAGREPTLSMTVGEPRHPVPDFVAPMLAANIKGFGQYPQARGTDGFRAAVAGWLGRRYGLGERIDPATMILPLNGSREGLFYAAIQARSDSRKAGRPAMLLPNPFYQTYAAAALAAGCEPIMVAAGPETGFLPDIAALPADVLARAIGCYYASPANPQGAVADRATLARLIELARAHDFLLFADECYSEIYRGVAAPAGALEVAAMTGSFDRVIVFNSLSKRSNLAGLRCGFAAGDPAFLKRWHDFRNMAAPQVPNPVQAVAVAAYADETHVIENRRLYDAKYAVAEAVLGSRFGFATPPGGFFLWLDVGAQGGGEAVTLRLWREAGLRVIPGGYLAATGADGRNPGDNYIRIALVDGLDLTREALTRLVETVG